MRTYWYRGELISRNANPYGIRWQVYCDGTFMYADTLAGIRQLIKGAIA